MKKERVRNADKARNSFVTRRAETKLGALTDLLKAAAGDRWVETKRSTLQREMVFTGFPYFNSLRLIYNWENRFMAVNYNLQLVSVIHTPDPQVEDMQDCLLKLHCKQHGLKGERDYTWEKVSWGADDAAYDAYVERLSNPLILKRLDALDIFEMEIRHDDGGDFWRISCESLIGSATWMLIPPVFSMITPKREECVRFLELFTLLGDAVGNSADPQKELDS